MNRTTIVVSILFLLTGAAESMSETASGADYWDVQSDTWVATDGLGRVLPTHGEVGSPRKDRFVGVFYFLWLGQHSKTGPHDVTKILQAHPDAMQDAEHPAWGPPHAYHHWGEPLFGYYISDDAYVIRKHAEMLSDADVDVIFFDVTNNITYRDCYMALCRVFTEVRRNGGRTPQIGFLCPFGNPAKVVRELYSDLYKPNLYPDLWFRWEGKPLIMADPDHVDEEHREFFTFRKPMPSYFAGPSGPNQWGWLEVHPQHVFHNQAGEAEQMTVGVAQNAVEGRLGSMSESKGAYGRSFHNGQKSDRPDAVLWGLNFEEQWQRAMEIDPKFMFITGWNEWVAMRLPEFAGVREPVMFVDQFDHEYSRDIEPMKGGHFDNYYYQMVSFIRRFKGARPLPTPSAPKTIALDGDFSQWDGVTPEFRHHIGSTVHRNHPGWGDAGTYINTTGRNDFVLLKVARDDSHLYFYAKTREPITAHTDPKWMMLFLNTDRDPKTGWEGYNFVLNRLPATEKALHLERSRDGWNWQSAGEIAYAVQGREIQLTIPRQALGLDSSAPIDIEFKWADNIQSENSLAEFIVSGDAAPSGRFNYRYAEKP